MTAGFGVATDTGRVRARNEDRVHAGGGVFVVADGMGGHAAGDVASAVAVESLRRLGERGDLQPDDVSRQIRLANEEILACSAEHPERAGMGTTVAGLGEVVVAGSMHWLVFNVGDSRVYRFAQGALTQLTVDHTEVEELVAAGRISGAEAAGHPLQGVVTRALGSDPGPEADLWVFPPGTGERFLLCSDGLPLELGHEEIAAVLGAEPDPQRAADRLVEQAVRAGGRDNVSVIVVDAGHPGTPEVAPDEAGATMPRRNAG